MEGVFYTPIKKYIRCLFFIISGSFIAVRFGLWGIDAVREGKTANAIFCFVFVLIGFLFGVFSIFLFNYNKGASLRVDGKNVSARFGFESEIHEPMSKIKKAELIRGGRSIMLYFPDRVCFITHLANAKEICEYICANISKSSPVMTVDEATENLRKHNKKRYLYLCLTVVFFSIMLVHIAWCVLLTNGKGFEAFSENDTLVFAGFAVAEIVTVILTFIFADKCGKQNKICETSRFTLLSAAAAEQKETGIEKYPNIIDKKFFDGYTYRIIIFHPADDVYAYMLERFDLTGSSWKPCYDAAIGFDNLPDLYDHLEESFDDVIFED